MTIQKLRTLAFIAIALIISAMQQVSAAPTEAMQWAPAVDISAVSQSQPAAMCPQLEASNHSLVEVSFADNQTMLQRCCKICRKGKACGNSCISRSYTCRQPPGCACDAR